MLPQWKRSRAILGGPQAAKAHDSTVSFNNLLIPFSTSMSIDQYRLLKAESELPCITAQFAKILVESLLRKRPNLEVKGKESLHSWILDEFGQDGMPIEASLAEAAHEELSTGFCWIFVDHPQLSEEDYAALTPAERKLVKPYPLIRTAEEVINWNYHQDTFGRSQLLFVVTRAYESEYASEALHPTVYEAIYVHRLNDKGNYEVQKWRGPAVSDTPVEAGRPKSPAADSQEGVGYTLVATMEPLAHDKPLNYIPAWPLGGTAKLRQPPLMPLIEKEIGLYNKMTRRNHLLYNASTFTPVVCADMVKSDFDKITEQGLGTWILLPMEAKIDKLTTPTEALADYEVSIANAIMEMAKLGVRMLAAESSQSGIALEIRNAAQTAQLGSLDTQISTTLRQVIRCMIHWYTGEEVALNDITFGLSSDFLAAVRDVNAMRMVTEWYENGHIPREVFVHILRENDYLPDGYDDSMGMKGIAAQRNLPQTTETLEE